MEVRIGVVAGSKVAVVGEGTEAGRVLQVVLANQHDVQTVHMMQDGAEFNPPGGVAVMVVQAGSAHKIAAAFDDGMEPIMEPGGRRIYSLSPTGDAVRAEVRLHPDGTVEVLNGAANFTMGPDGVFSFHGAATHFDHSITVTGGITATATISAPHVEGTTDVAFGGKSAAGHKHTGPQGGQTGVPV